MKLVMTQYDRTVTIECSADDLTIFEVADDLIRPALAGVGFSENSIRKILDFECECDH